MPKGRRLKQDELETSDVPATQEEGAPVVAKKKSVLYEPYDGPESLEGEEYAPKMSKGRATQPGKPKYVITRNADTYKVIAVYRNAKGIARRLVRVLKPKKRRNIDDRAVMAQLYAWKIPGAEPAKYK